MKKIIYGSCNDLKSRANTKIAVNLSMLGSAYNSMRTWTPIRRLWKKTRSVKNLKYMTQIFKVPWDNIYLERCRFRITKVNKFCLTIYYRFQLAVTVIFLLNVWISLMWTNKEHWKRFLFYVAFLISCQRLYLVICKYVKVK